MQRIIRRSVRYTSAGVTQTCAVVNCVPSSSSSVVTAARHQHQQHGLMSTVPTSWESPEALTELKRLSVALVGRPNVGKSSLFNRLTGTKAAIVSNVPGTTRDRKVGWGNLAGLPFQVMDTGGLDDRGAVSMKIQEQVHQALLSADVLLFMLDGKVGVTSLDHHFAQWLRKKTGEMLRQPPHVAGGVGLGSEISTSEPVKRQKEIIVLVNKTEGANLSDQMLDTISEALRLGLGEPIPISTTHGDGLVDLAQILIKSAENRGYETGEGVRSKITRAMSDGPITLEDRVIQLAIMGRPNVGKSSLLNAFIGEERVIVGATPGLTRDSIGVEWMFRDRQFKLVDTAGLTRIRTDKKLMNSPLELARRAVQDATGSEKSRDLVHAPVSKVNRSVELPGIDLMSPDEDPSQFSHRVSELALLSALNALRFAQVVLIVIESTQGKFSKVDLQLARKCLEEGRAVVIAANKSDLALRRGVMPQAYEDGVREHCDSFMREFGSVPIVACTATDGQGVQRLLQTVLRVHDSWSKRIPTWTLNLWLKDMLVSQAPTRYAGKTVTVKYMTQVLLIDLCLCLCLCLGMGMGLVQADAIDTTFVPAWAVKTAPTVHQKYLCLSFLSPLTTDYPHLISISSSRRVHDYLSE